MFLWLIFHNMANLLLIKSLLKERSISIRDFSKELGMTEQGLQKLIRENSTKVDTLELIANKLNVSTSIFFEGERTSETDRLLSIIKSQQEQLSKSQEQIDRLISIIEKQNK